MYTSGESGVKREYSLSAFAIYERGRLIRGEKMEGHEQRSGERFTKRKGKREKARLPALSSIAIKM